MTKNEKMDFICNKLGEREILAQFAEEAIEVALAALKLRRTMSKKNPTPVKYEDALANLNEEHSDYMLCASLLGGTYGDPEIMDRKLDRWVSRIEEASRKEKHET